MIQFVGAGPGAEDLITVRGAKLLEQADVVVYAGSLVNPAHLARTKQGCQIYDSASMTLEQVMDVMIPAAQAGKLVVRLHTGDPSIYGAIREQMDVLDEQGIAYDVCPGVSSFCGAAAALHANTRCLTSARPSFSAAWRAEHRCRSANPSASWHRTAARWCCFCPPVCWASWQRN